MGTFKAQKNREIPLMIVLLIIVNCIVGFIILKSKSYAISSFLKMLLVVCDIYQIYFIMLSFTVCVNIIEDSVVINSFFGFKKSIIPIEKIKGYYKGKGKISGVRLSGYGFGSFIFGRCFVDKIGIINMFVTSNKDILYLITDDLKYALSIRKMDEFETALKTKQIRLMECNEKIIKNNNILHKDKNFIIPFFSVSIICIIITLIPFLLYLKNKLPDVMPLSFSTDFIPTEMGTGKQFAFQQMIYGALNMGLLFCMYYAAHFNSKYDRKSSYKYIYYSLFIAVLFLFIQLKIIFTFVKF